MSGLALCPSPTHRSLLGLLRAATGREVGASLAADLNASDPDKLVRHSVNTYVHVVVATAFRNAPSLTDAVPRDLMILFSELQDANIRRNDAIRAQLFVIGQAMSDAGLRGLVHKGGAELLAPIFPDPAFRFLSDTDILLPDGEVETAVRTLIDIGAMSDPDDTASYHHHHHVAALQRGDWPVPVELHRQLYGPRRGRGMGLADSVRGAALPSDIPGLDVPSPIFRLAHSVFHAQIQTPRFQTRALSLRDLLEFDAFHAALPPDDIAQARTLFSETADVAAWDALSAARQLVLGSPAEAEPLPAPAQQWAEAAIIGFGRPRKRSVTTAAWNLRRYAEDMLLDPARRRHFLRQITRPGGLRRVLAARRDEDRRIR